MRALSLWQPWASFMFAALPFPPKTIETRSRNVVGRYRGLLAIHATAREPAWVWDEMSEELCAVYKRFLGQRCPDLPRGCVLGLVYVEQVQPTENVLFPTEHEELLGDYTEGRTAIVTRTPRVLETPLPWRGRQGLWTLPDDALRGRRYFTGNRYGTL